MGSPVKPLVVREDEGAGIPAVGGDAQSSTWTSGTHTHTHTPSEGSSWIASQESTGKGCCCCWCSAPMLRVWYRNHPRAFWVLVAVSAVFVGVAILVYFLVRDANQAESSEKFEQVSAKGMGGEQATPVAWKECMHACSLTATFGGVFLTHWPDPSFFFVIGCVGFHGFSVVGKSAVTHILFLHLFSAGVPVCVAESEHPTGFHQKGCDCRPLHGIHQGHVPNSHAVRI